MDEHPNATWTRAFIDDEETSIGEYVTDDVEWNFIGPIPPLHGKAAVVARYEGPPSNPNLKQTGQTTHDVVANDTHAIALLETTFQKGEETFTYRTAEIYHLRDGKISARWAFAEDTEAINRFFGS